MINNGVHTRLENQIVDNNLTQDLTLDKLDKLTAEGKIKDITMTVTSIDDGTITIIHAD